MIPAPKENPEMAKQAIPDVTDEDRRLAYKWAMLMAPRSGSNTAHSVARVVLAAVMNHDANEPDAAELSNQIEMNQLTIDQLTKRAQRLDAELTSARRRRVGAYTAAVAVPMTIGTIALAAGPALDTIGFAQAIFIITIAISAISTGKLANMGYQDNETKRIAEDLADTRKEIDKAATERHALMQKLITRT